MFVKSLVVKNFRCFEDLTISNFGVPNGTEGSGLNIFIGENGNGKTTILESIKLLTQNRLKTKGYLSIQDFYDIEKKIEISSTASSDFDVKRAIPKGSFKANGFHFYANPREKDSKSNLVEHLTFDNLYRQSDSQKLLEPELRLEVQNLYGSRFSEMQIIYLDKRRTRSVSDGQHPDKFNSLLSDFNFQFSKDKNNFKISSDLNDDIRTKLLPSKGADKILTQIIKDFKDVSGLDVKLDHLNILEPFNSAFFAVRDLHKHQQIPVSKLGSGYEMIFTILYLQNYYALAGKKTILLIDEPELHLHPKLQNILIKTLLNISKDSQIIISTHSPYLFKNLMTTPCKQFLFTKDNNGKVNIEDANVNGWGLFSWSPSWGEVNYFAYNLPTVEFHNELFGYIQSEKGLNSIVDVDSYFLSKGIQQNKQWTDDRPNPVATTNVTLPYYIRNKIHHPENTHNSSYTESELESSIKTMVDLIKVGL